MGNRIQKKRERRQKLAKIIVNLAFVSYGLAAGWPSSSFLILASEKSPLDAGPLTDDDLSWINSMLSIAAFVGTVIFYCFSFICGRKRLLCLLAIPQIACWVTVIYAKKIWHLFASRALSGVAVGGSFILVPLFIDEITEEGFTPKFGAILLLSTNIGYFISFTAGLLLPYKVVPMVFVGFPIVFLILMLFLPESPVFLMMNEKMEEAEKSLRFYRNTRQSVDVIYFSGQLELLQKKSVNKCSEYVIPYSWDINTRQFKKSVALGIGLMILQELSGCFTMLSYSAIIFDKSGSLKEPQESVLTVGIIQLIGTYLAVYVIQRVSRRRLLSISFIGTSLSLICFGIFSLLYELKYDVGPFSWTTVASFSSMVFAASFGIQPLPSIMLTEIIPKRVLNFGFTICLSFAWITSFILTKYLEFCINTYGLYSCLFGFAICSFLGFLFVQCIVPEKMEMEPTDEEFEVDDSSPIFEIF